MLALFVPSTMRSSRALKPLSCRNLHPNPGICRLWAGDGAHSPKELSPPAAAPKELMCISGAAQNVPSSQGHSLYPPPDCSALGMPQGTQAPALTDVSSHSSRGCGRERGALGASPSSPSCSWPCPLLCQAPLPGSPCSHAASWDPGSIPRRQQPPLHRPTEDRKRRDPPHTRPRLQYQRNGSCPGRMEMPPQPHQHCLTLSLPLW